MIRLLAWWVERLSPRAVVRLGNAIGWVVYALLRVRRRVTLSHLRAALGVEGARARRLGRRVYQHMGRGAVEFLGVGALDAASARRLLGSGLERIADHAGPGRGALVLSAHLGNWDLLACCAALCGLPVNVVTREIKSSWINRYWMSQRARCGVRLLPARGSGRQIVAALRRGELVAMVLDQHEPGGHPAPFFHQPAATTTSLARLARATGAPVVPVFLLRRRQGHGYRLVVHEPLELQRTDSASQDARSNTERFTRVLEQQIRATPEQWLWLHRRWKLGRT